jgi:hypothetical protein
MTDRPAAKASLDRLHHSQVRNDSKSQLTESSHDVNFI